MRVYDPRIGKFLSVDPLAKNFAFYSPYHYAGNNPIRNKDLDGGEPQDYTYRWIFKPLFDIGTGKEVSDLNGMLVTDPKLGQIDVQMVYDKFTKQVWFVHEDEVSRNFYYYKSDNGNGSEMSINPKTNEVRKGHFEQFTTQDRQQARQGYALADDMATAVFGMVAVGVTLPAATALGGADLWALNNPFTKVGAIKALAGGSADIMAQKILDPHEKINWISVAANALFVNPFSAGAAASSGKINEKNGKVSFEFSNTKDFLIGTAINGTLGAVKGKLVGSFEPLKLAPLHDNVIRSIGMTQFAFLTGSFGGAGTNAAVSATTTSSAPSNSSPLNQTSEKHE